MCRCSRPEEKTWTGGHQPANNKGHCVQWWCHHRGISDIIQRGRLIQVNLYKLLTLTQCMKTDVFVKLYYYYYCSKRNSWFKQTFWLFVDVFWHQNLKGDLKWTDWLWHTDFTDINIFVTNFSSSPSVAVARPETLRGVKKQVGNQNFLFSVLTLVSFSPLSSDVLTGRVCWPRHHQLLLLFLRKHTRLFPFLLSHFLLI